jgi:hypothetical protein
MEGNIADKKNTISEKTGFSPKRKRLLGVLILGGIPLLFILYLVLGPILDILRKDIAAKEMFVVSEFVNVRSTSDNKSLKMGQLLYGTSVLVYEVKEEWAKVLIDGRKVYVSGKYLVPPDVYYTIEGIFGDSQTSKQVKNSKYRLALYHYFQSKGFGSQISDDIKEKYFNDPVEKEIYQLVSEPKGTYYNSTAFGDFDGDFSQDAAFVIRHKETGNKILVVISFDKHDPLSNSKVIYETELDEPWMYIRLAKKGASYQIAVAENEYAKLKLPANGLLIGSNRSRDLKDPVHLLYYNGEKFETFKLK